ncbi:hypothetical protein ACHAXA_006162 [Cyclostephanos tholiformis]|uniref:Cell division control protein 45 n=1 Tax=Cyclostephanos tholiformis TaxID=382380 RepID=A0ABD3RY92_9STRA
MILEREQWHLGYASLLRDCREGGGESSLSSTSGGVVGPGRALILVHPDVDAMSSARILGYMLRADGVPYQMRPCPGWGRLRRVLSGMGVVSSVAHDGEEDGGNRIHDEYDDDDDDDGDGIRKGESYSSSCDVRAVVLVNMGANRNLARLFRSSSSSFPSSHAPSRGGGSSAANVRCYVLDCRRPYHLANVHAGKNVVLFNDRPFEDGEVPSDGDDLSGNDETSDDSDDDDGGSDGGGKDGRGDGGMRAGWEEDDSESSDGENEFMLDDDDDGEEGGGEGLEGDEHDIDEDEDDDDDDDDHDTGMGGGPAKRRRTVKLTTSAEDPALDDDDLRDSDEDEDDDDDDDDGGGETFKKKGRRSMSGGGRGVRDPLNTTAATADLTNVMDETLMTTSSTPWGEGGGGDDISSRFVDFRELRRMRRNRIRLHYSSGSYHGSPSSWTAYALARQLRFGDVPDLLWLACVGVTDAYLHGRLDVAGYSALSIDLRRHVGRLFPNDAIDRAERAVYAEELESNADNYGEDGNSYNSGGGGNRALTKIGLSENGRILFQDEYKFMLLRHTSLWDSMLHSNFVASKLQVWKSAGRQRLMELLARMGFPLDQCRQPWAFVGPVMRRSLGERLRDCTEEYGLENVSYTGFVRVTGYKSLLSASDMSYAVTALLECSAAAMEGSAGGGSNNDDEDDVDPLPLSEEDREDREMIEAFNVAFDALNSNGGGPSISAAATGALASMLTEGGGVEGADLSNLVNGGNMSGTTGLGAGIRLAMTLQRNIMATARGLVDRNAITRLSHFRYAYLHSSGGGSGGGGGGSSGRVVTPDAGKNGDVAPSSSSRRSDQFHVFAKPLVLTRLAHFLMDMHREDGKWTGIKSRPLVLMAEKPRSSTYMVVGYECPEEAGNVVRNKFGQNFELAAKSMKGTFWFDSFDSNVVEVAGRDVQKFLEQLHYMMEQV